MKDKNFARGVVVPVITILAGISAIAGILIAAAIIAARAFGITL